MEPKFKVGDKIIWHHIREKDVINSDLVHNFERSKGKILTIRSLTSNYYGIKIDGKSFAVYFDEVRPAKITNWRFQF